MGTGAAMPRVLCALGSRVHHDPVVKRSTQRYASHAERRLDTTVSYDASSSAGFASLRIHVHFDEQLIVGLNTAKQAFLRRLTSEAVAYWEAALLVRRVQGCCCAIPLDCCS